MITLEEAQGRIISAARPLASEEIPLHDALGRYLATPLNSSIDLPPADNSAMDGYAARSADLASATPEKPVALRLAGEARAGSTDAGAVEAGACARVFTGAPLPRGADAVVMQEDVRREAGPPVKIIFTEAARPWENIRLRGEDVRQKALLADAGEELTPQRLSLLAAAGLTSVPVARQPRVALLATGDELREGGTPLAPGTIFESNRAGLAAMTRRAGGLPRIHPIVPDDLGLTKQALRTALADADIVVTSGGVSVGEHDLVKDAFTEIGGELDLWQVAIRPGKPFAFGRHGGKLFCGLPGNAVSALVTFHLLVRPALLRMQGARELGPIVAWGKLEGPLTNRGERRHFVRVILDAQGHARSAGAQGSHMLSSMSLANGLIDVPPGANWPSGTLVAVLRWT